MSDDEWRDAGVAAVREVLGAADDEDPGQAWRRYELHVAAGGRDLIGDAAGELAEAVDAWRDLRDYLRDRGVVAGDDAWRARSDTIRSFGRAVTFFEERMARCAELAHDLGQVWLAVQRDPAGAGHPAGGDIRDRFDVRVSAERVAVTCRRCGTWSFVETLDHVRAAAVRHETVCEAGDDRVAS